MHAQVLDWQHTHRRYINKIKIHSSCEIEEFVETHLCKMCVILLLRSRVSILIADIGRRLLNIEFVHRPYDKSSTGRLMQNSGYSTSGPRGANMSVDVTLAF